jgi:hypothetical protein
MSTGWDRDMGITYAGKLNEGEMAEEAPVSSVRS